MLRPLHRSFLANICGIVLLAVSGLSQSEPAHAGPPERRSAVASFTSQDPTGCVMTEVSVFARSNGKTGQQPRLRLKILKVNECQRAVLLDIEARANLHAGAFSVSRDLGSARLHVSLPVVDHHSRKRLTATVRLSWTAVEQAIIAARTDEQVEPGKFMKMKTPVQRAIRLARAFGTVSTSAGN